MAGRNHHATSRHDAEHEHDRQKNEQLDRHDLLVDQVLGLLLQLSASPWAAAIRCSTCCRRRSWATRSPAASTSFGRPSFSPPVIADSICVRNSLLARAVDFKLVLGRGDHLLGGFDRAGLRRELLDDVARDPRRNLAGAGPLVG